MQRIDDRTVELNPVEQMVYDHFDEYQHALGIQDAAMRALDEHAYGPAITAEFVRFLSDGTLDLVGGQIIPNDCQNCHRGGASILTVSRLRIQRLCTDCRDRLATSKSEAGRVRLALIAQVLGLALLGGALGWWLNPARNYEAPPVNQPAFVVQSNKEPYGGCKEAANYPWTKGWRWCVRNERIIVSLRPCWREDGPPPCVWDARHLGNGRGDNVIMRKGNKSPRTVSHRMAHVLVKNWRTYEN